MSMNPGQENFQELRRLLALKRHEQPPPGYFNDFSAQVIARIRECERLSQQSTIERLLEEAPWFRRVWALLESRPVLVGAAGAAFCGLMLTVVLASEHIDTTPTTLVPVAAAERASAPAVAATNDDQSAPTPLFANTEKIDLSNPGVAPATPARGSSLFQDFQNANPRAWPGSPVPANFTVPQGN